MLIILTLHFQKKFFRPPPGGESAACAMGINNKENYNKNKKEKANRNGKKSVRSQIKGFRYTPTRVRWQ